MKTEMNEMNRTTLFGEVVEEMNGGRIRVAYTDAATGDTIERVLMNDMIANTKQLGDGTTAWMLTDVTIKGTTISGRDTYKCAIDGNEQQDTYDLWAEGEVAGESYDDEVGIDEDEVGIDEVSIDDDEVSIDDDEIGIDDYDDSVPVAQVTDIDMSDLIVDELVGLTGKTAKQTAGQKAAKAREALYAAASKVQEGMKTDMAKAMVQGKRHKDFGAWNFKAQALSVDVRVTDGDGNITHEPMHDSEGNDRVRVIVNPTLAGKDGHPSYGAVMNRAAGPNYQHIDHPDIFIPCIEAVEDIDGVQWDAYSFNNGARAGLTIDISAMATTARKEAGDQLEGFLNLDANAQSSFLEEENGGHRCGVTIVNSHDGKQALSAFVTVMRAYCQNLAVRGANQTLVRVQHSSGSIAAFDVDVLAAGMRTSFLEAQQHLLSMAVLRNIPVEMNGFDKMLTAFDRLGLISPPSVTVDVDDLNKLKGADGKVVINKNDMKTLLKVSRGHAYNAVNKGWMNPDLDYVKCEEESVGTMFHVAQCVSGYLTHKPIFSDGKRVLTGHSEGLELFMKKSSKATAALEEVAHSAVATYLEHTGQESLGVGDMADFKQFFADNPNAIKIAFKPKGSRKKAAMTSLEEIPLYHETWQPKVITKAIIA